jgi:hypothetical protein
LLRGIEVRSAPSDAPQALQAFRGEHCSARLGAFTRSDAPRSGIILRAFLNKPPPKLFNPRKEKTTKPKPSAKRVEAQKPSRTEVWSSALTRFPDRRKTELQTKPSPKNHEFPPIPDHSKLFWGVSPPTPAKLAEPSPIHSSKNPKIQKSQRARSPHLTNLTNLTDLTHLTDLTNLTHFHLLPPSRGLSFTPPEPRVCGCSFRLRKEVNEQPNP